MGSLRNDWSSANASVFSQVNVGAATTNVVLTGTNVWVLAVWFHGPATGQSLTIRADGSSAAEGHGVLYFESSDLDDTNQLNSPVPIGPFNGLDAVTTSTNSDYSIVFIKGGAV